MPILSEDRIAQNKMDKIFPSNLSKTRLKAIDILESIADKMGDGEMFDCAGGSTLWYDLEEMIVEILERK